MQTTTTSLLSLSTPCFKPPNRTRYPKFTQLSISSARLLDLNFIRELPGQSFRKYGFFSISNQGAKKLKVNATSTTPAGGDVVKPSGVIRTLRLGAMFGIWYLFNIYFNVYNKQVLKVYPFPATVTAFEFGVGALMIVFMWASNFATRPKITPSQLAVILPLAVAHTMGNLLTNISLGKVSVSFTHTIKAMEPFFTVVLSALVVGEVSFMILEMVSPVTHSVGSCVKRIVVIVSSIIFFQTPVLLINSLGTAMTLAGVFLYSKAKRIKPKPKAA